MHAYQFLTVSSWPVYVDWTAKSSKQTLLFSWNPAISNCPTAEIHYYILSANCGSCLYATADTFVTCTDVPLFDLCILAVQTVVNGSTVKDLLSDPAYVSMNQTRNYVQIGSNYNNSKSNTGKEIIS